MILKKIIDEISAIPEAQQEELYKLIQDFRHQAIADEVIPLGEMWKEIENKQLGQAAQTAQTQSQPIGSEAFTAALEKLANK